MDTALQAIFSWQFIFFCLGISAIVQVIRTIVEYALKHTPIPKESTLWRDLILPILPILLGAGCGFLFKKYPFPEGVSADSARVVFGIVAGMSANIVYRMYTVFLGSKIKGFISGVTSATTTQPTNTPDNPADPGAAVRDTIKKD